MIQEKRKKNVDSQVGAGKPSQTTLKQLLGKGLLESCPYPKERELVKKFLRF